MSRKASWSFEDSSLERSFLWSLAITVLPVASGFIISWVIARWAGPRVIGTVAWVMSFATAVLIVGKFGLDLAASRMASEYGVKNPGVLRYLLRTAIGLRLIFTLGVAALSLLFASSVAAFFGDPTLTVPIRIGAAVVVCASLYEFKENFLVGLNRLKAVYMVRSVALGTRIVLTCGLVFLGFGASVILTGYCVAWIVAIITYGILLFRFLPPQGSEPVPPDTARRLLVLSATLAVSSASVTVYSHMDRLMLGYFSGVEEVGQYAVARNITEVSLFPVFAMIMMLRPALAARFSPGRSAESAQIIRNSLKFSLVSGTLFAAIFAALGVPLVTLVFSADFRYSGDLMAFFIWIIALRSIGAVILPALVAAERTRLYAYLTTASALINFLLNLILIPMFQSRGAILATIISYSFLLLFGLKEVFDTYEVRVRLAGMSVAFRTILAGVISSMVIWWTVGRSSSSWDALLWAVVLSILYVVLILVFRVGTFSDLRGLFINLRNSKG